MQLPNNVKTPVGYFKVGMLVYRQIQLVQGNHPVFPVGVQIILFTQGVKVSNRQHSQ